MQYMTATRIYSSYTFKLMHMNAHTHIKKNNQQSTLFNCYFSFSFLFLHKSDSVVVLVEIEEEKEK